MILPPHCKSCGKVIGHLWFRYLEKVKFYQKEKLKHDEELGGEEAEKEALASKVPESTPEAKALDDLLIHRYCCRLMFLTQPDNLVDMFRNRIQN